MILWAMKWIVISLSVITLIHYIYIFLIDMLTVPKLRDFVNNPNDRYKEILAISNKNIDQQPKNEMQDELMDFLNNIKKDDTNVSADFQPSNETTSYTSY